MNVRHLLALLPAFLLTCCGTTLVKQIAGDRVPQDIGKRLCDGSWKGADGTVAVFRIEDEAKGLVEVRTLDADGTEDKAHLAFRTLGERVVATVWGKEQTKEGEPALFFRATITDDHVAFFPPANEKLKDAVKKGLITGEIREDTVHWGDKDAKKPQKIESALLEKFGLAEADKLGGVLNCFDPDPAIVLVKEIQPRPAAKEGEGGSKKK